MSDLPHTIDGERHVSEVAVAPRINRRHGFVIFGLAGLAIALYFGLKSSDHGKTAAKTQPSVISQYAEFEPAKTQIAEPPPQAPAATEQSYFPSVQPEIKDPLVAARAAFPLGKESPDAPVKPVAASSPVDPDGVGGGESELASKLHATILTGSKASILPHPEFFLTMGTMIPCVLQTAIDSSAPGLVVCVTQQDAYGSTGSVTLMEKGTKIVGEYSSQMSQGQNRLFVLWNRAETPNHVVITLGSPASDALGRAGFDGHVDTHFWERFGGALMMTFIDGAFSTANALASKAGSTSFNLSGSSNAATEALRNTVNIPPTLTKNQGEVVAVMAARDLDFSAVYKLGLRH